MKGELDELSAAGRELAAAVPSEYERRPRIGPSSNNQNGLSGVTGETRTTKERG